MSTEQKEFEYEEMEISFARIVKQCIKKIKIIMLLAVLLAIIVPSLVYVKEKKDYKDATIQLEEDKEIELTEDDKAAVERYFLLKSRVEYFEEREELSPVMKLNFENVYEGKMIYYIDAEPGVNADIARAFQKYVGDQSFVELFTKKIGVKDFPYLNEIIRISSPEENSGVVHITVWTEKKEKCEEYMKVLNEIVIDYSKYLQSSIESHEIRLVTEEVNKKIIESVYIEQNKFYADKKVAKEELDAWKNNSLTDTAKKAIASLELEEESVEEGDELISPSFSIKYLVLGGVLGLVLGVLLIFVVTIFDGKIQTEHQLSKQFGLKCLGIIGLNPRTRKNNEMELELLALNIKKYLEKIGVKKVHFIGTISSKREEIQSLSDILVSEDINCIIEEGIIGNAEEFHKLQGETLVIVERVGESKIKEITSEIQMCNLLDIHVMGYICITD